jgi:hypothetical protein
MVLSVVEPFELQVLGAAAGKLPFRFTKYTFEAPAGVVEELSTTMPPVPQQAACPLVASAEEVISMPLEAAEIDAGMLTLTAKTQPSSPVPV